MPKHVRFGSVGLWLLVGSLAGVTLPAEAGGDPVAGAAKAGVCVACHGADGIGKARQYPNLRRQKAAYLEKQLKAFRDGERKDPFMSAMAKPLSDRDISNLAAYFERIR